MENNRNDIRNIANSAEYGFDSEGEVRNIYDIDPNANFEIPDDSEAEFQALAEAESSVRRVRTVMSRGKTTKRYSRRGGRSHPELSGRDRQFYVDQALVRESVSLGRELTDDEERVITAQALRELNS